MMRGVRILLYGLLLVAFGCNDANLVDGQMVNDGSEVSSTHSKQSSARPVFPEIIPLPDGFQPEGIASGRGTTFYVGSLANGAVYKGDFRTGEGSLVVGPQQGRIAVGLKFDSRSNLLFVAGGANGNAFVYDARTGASFAEYLMGGTFVNDVVVTREAAYFTESFAPVLYRVSLGRQGAPPRDSDAFETITLGGDFNYIPGSFNTNGIAATPNGKALIIVNSTTGTLYLVDPDTGQAEEIEGVSVPAGDGILLHGKTLYVVQNQLNQIAVISLSPDYQTGTLVDTITSPQFRVPTTIASFGNALYAVNARFGVTPTPDTEYEVVRVER